MTGALPSPEAAAVTQGQGQGHIREAAQEKKHRLREVRYQGNNAVTCTLDELAGAITTAVTAKPGWMARLHPLTKPAQNLKATQYTEPTVTHQTLKAPLRSKHRPTKTDLERIDRTHRQCAVTTPPATPSNASAATDAGRDCRSTHSPVPGAATAAARGGVTGR